MTMRSENGCCWLMLNVAAISVFLGPRLVSRAKLLTGILSYAFTANPNGGVSSADGVARRRVRSGSSRGCMVAGNRGSRAIDLVEELSENGSRRPRIVEGLGARRMGGSGHFRDRMLNMDA